MSQRLRRTRAGFFQRQLARPATIALILFLLLLKFPWTKKDDHAKEPILARALESPLFNQKDTIVIVAIRIPLYDSRGSDMRLLEIVRGLHATTQARLIFVADAEYPEEVQERHIASLTSLDRVEIIWSHKSNPIAALQGRRITAVFFHHWYWNWPQATLYEKYAPAMRQLPDRPPLILINDDVHGHRLRLAAQRKGDEILFHKSRQITRNENRTIHSADLTVAITGGDAIMFQNQYKVAKSKVLVWRYTQPKPLDVSGALHRNCASRKDLLFVGGPNDINEASVIWFGEKVLPLIQEKVREEILLKVAGLVNLPRRWLSAHTSVRRLGQQSDLSELLHSSRVFVSPVLYGTGINTKNVLALSSDIPLVTTSYGTSAFLPDTSSDQQPFSYLRTNDDASAFAASVADIYTNCSLWESLVTNAETYYSRNHDRQALAEDAAKALSFIRSLNRASGAAIHARASLAHAYVTFIDRSEQNDHGYIMAAQALAQSIRATGSSQDVVLMVSSHLPAEDTAVMMATFDRVIDAEPIENTMFQDMMSDKLPFTQASKARWRDKYPEQYQRSLYSKLALWSLTQYTKIVYLDSDIILLRNMDELFDRPAISACPDMMPPDTFNSGLMVIEPSATIFSDMMANLTTLPSYNGGDQGFLNRYFSDWYASGPEHRLSSYYNVQTKLRDAFPPAWMLLEPNIRALHFSPLKPWNDPTWAVHEADLRSTRWERQRLEGLADLHKLWWRHYSVSPSLDYWGIQPEEDAHVPLNLPGSLRITLYTRNSRSITGQLYKVFKRYVGEAQILHVTAEETNRQLLYQKKMDLLILVGDLPDIEETIADLRIKLPKLVVMYWWLVPTLKTTIASLDIDVLFTNSRILQKRYHSICPTFYMPPAADPEGCHRLVPALSSSLSLVGDFGRDTFTEDQRDLLTEASDLGLTIYGENWGKSQWADLWRTGWNGNSNEVLASSTAMLSLAQPFAKQFDMIPPEIFQALACGTPVITDYPVNPEDDYAPFLHSIGGIGDISQHLEDLSSWRIDQTAQYSEAAIAYIRASHSYEHRVGYMLRVYHLVKQKLQE